MAPLGALVAAVSLGFAADVAAVVPMEAGAPPKPHSRSKSFLSILTWHSWRAEDVPNPYSHPAACNIPRRGYLCDPDALLSADARVKVLNVMDLTRQNTSAECSDGSRPGFQVAAVIIQKMASSEFRGDGVSEAAQRFARAVGNHWGVGDKGCDNGVIMFLSIDDRYGYIATGKTSMHVLTDSLATEVIDNMKPMLRDRDYSSAVLQGVLQIYDVLSGKGLPASRGLVPYVLVYIGLVFALVFCCMKPDQVMMCCCFSWTALLFPFALLADRFKDWRQQSKDKEEQEQAQRELVSVQKELERDEFDQAVCPICLESLERQATPQEVKALECKHCYHAQCIDPWVLEHGNCPLCRADASLTLNEEDSGKPDSYQRRLRGYLAAMRARHPRIFQYSQRPSAGQVTARSGPVYEYDQTGTWTFFPLVYDSAYTSRGYVAGGYADSVNSQYNSTMQSAQAWSDRLAATRASYQASQSDGGSSGSRGFGGGGFSGGGGGGGGW